MGTGCAAQPVVDVPIVALARGEIDETKQKEYRVAHCGRKVRAFNAAGPKRSSLWACTLMVLIALLGNHELTGLQWLLAIYKAGYGVLIHPSSQAG